MDWSARNVVEMGLLLSVAGFLLPLHRDVSWPYRAVCALSGCVACEEGLLKGLRDSVAG